MPRDQFTDRTASSAQSIDAEIAQLKTELGLTEANDDARAWWSALEAQRADPPHELAQRLRSLRPCLELYQQLEQKNGGLLDEFYRAAQRSGTKNFAAQTSFFFWCLTVRLECQQMFVS